MMTSLPPTELPVFPLSGALLLPHARLPLNIFEERYLAMVEDVLASGRYMGMIQTRSPYPGVVPGDAPVYGVGCAGKLTGFAEAEDGRFLITLSGLCRFRIEGEIDGRKGYRRWAVSYDDFTDDLQNDTSRTIDRSGLLAIARIFFKNQNAEVDWDAVADADDCALVTALALSCPFEPAEKQALLEARDTAARAMMLTTLFEMAIRSSGDIPPSGHN